MFGKIVYKYLNLDYIQRYKSALSIISGGNRDEIPCKLEKSDRKTKSHVIWTFCRAFSQTDL